MIRPLISVSGYAPAFQDDRLSALVARIADDDRRAFRTLYTLLVMRVWRNAIRLLPPGDARAVTRSTFVEIWHLARYQLDHGTRGTSVWIQSITARRISDRIRIAGGPSLPINGDDHTRCELTKLLSNSQAQFAPARDLRRASTLLRHRGHLPRV